MDNLLKEFENIGCKVEVGCKGKRRKKIIIDSIKKLKDSCDDDRISCAKNLYRYYCALNSMGYILNPKQIPFDEDKYGIHYLCSYLDIFLDSAKMIITPGVIEALGNDEPLDPFCKYLMFTHMYTPEQVKEIGHEEIYRREQKFKEELV